MAGTASESEIQMIQAEVSTQGSIVRDLKAAGEDASEAIAKLIELKKKLAAAKGEEFLTGKDKKKAKKAKKAGEKTERQLKKEARQKAREEAARQAKGPEGLMSELVASHDFGRFSLVRSEPESLTERRFVSIGDITEAMEGETVTVRGFLQTVRGQGGRAFLLLRSSIHTLQAHYSGNKKMVKFIAGLTRESIVDVTGVVSVPPAPISTASMSNLELQVTKCFLVNAASSNLPFQVKDAAAPVSREASEAASRAADAGIADVDVAAEDERGFAHVGQDTRLDFRWIDLRTPANQAIFRLRSATSAAFRNYLLERGFTEINSPKIIATASEGGAEVFNVDFFGGKAYLAQSPQLYKQMAICAGLEKVFEIGPVFRAENSNTHKHLCEFVGLDIEMAFKEDYHEVLEVILGTLAHIFDELGSDKYAHLREAVNEQYPFEPLQYTNPILTIEYADAVAMLTEAGVELGDGSHGDLDSACERELGRLVKEKYGTDVFCVDSYPSAVRPFYTMVRPEDPSVSNSYDIFIRGREIMSGAQRIHDPNLLVERANSLGVDLTPIQSYVDSFKHGAPPHAGGGVGLERVVMLYLDLDNIRKASMFPRDPSRVLP